MADHASFASTGLAQGRYGKPGTPGVTFAEVTGFGLYRIAGWPDTMAKVARRAAEAAGSKDAPGPGRSVAGDTGALLRVEPLAWWMFRETDRTPVAELGAADGVILDLSASRRLIRITGPQTPALLNAFLPLDLRESQFVPDSVASSAFHHVGVTLWRDDDTWNLFLPRSFSGSLVELLSESALQHGLEVL